MMGGATALLGLTPLVQDVVPDLDLHAKATTHMTPEILTHMTPEILTPYPHSHMDDVVRIMHATASVPRHPAPVGQHAAA